MVTSSWSLALERVVLLHLAMPYPSLQMPDSFWALVGKTGDMLMFWQSMPPTITRCGWAFGRFLEDSHSLLIHIALRGGVAGRNGI